MIYSLTKIDIRLFNHQQELFFQSISHALPVVLDNVNQEYSHIHEVLEKHEARDYFHYENPFGLEYVAVGIWEGKFLYGTVLVGPFISSISTIDLIKDMMLNNQLPISERKQLEEFYQSLPALNESEYKHLGEMMVNLCSHHFIHAKMISTETSKPLLDHENLRISIEENQHRIMARYEHQNQLMEAITKGDKEEVNRLINFSTDIVEFTERIPGSPIRSSKNIAFVLNTLFRIAAERSGVHPVYLHHISERFAILIERTSNLPSLQKLIDLMGDDYCQLVHTFATGRYSSMIKKCVDYILLYFGHPISLGEIAKAIHVNPSHLSRKFKEETGVTVTDYINQKRIEEAKVYLRRGNSSITDIAFMVGFNDLNYFSKVFKKLTSSTPTQYARTHFN